MLANALNRNQLSDLRAENEHLKNTQTATQTNESENALTDDEIAQKIAEADRNPDNFAFQKNLGRALYRYATMRQDSELLEKVSRLLERANKLNAKDYDVLVALGNVNFDIAYLRKDNEKFQEAREFYEKALEQKPSDSDVRTDLGLTYFLTAPSDNEKATAELQKSLEANHKNEKALQFLIQAFLKQNKTKEAEKYIELLRAVNQNNETLPELTVQLADSKNKSEKQ